MSEAGGGDHKRRASLPRKANPRLPAGRARALGLPTRGTTNANRLRRVDRWIVATQVPRLREHFAQFGKKLPHELEQQLERLAHALGEH